jgi:hypothetical protein
MRGLQLLLMATILLLLLLLLPPQQRAGAVFYDAETLPGQTLAPRRRSHSPENSRHLQVNVLFACPETVLANGWVFKEKVVFPKGFAVSPPLHHAQPFGRHWCHAARQQHHSARIERPFDQLMRCACYSLESVWVDGWRLAYRQGRALQRLSTSLLTRRTTATASRAARSCTSPATALSASRRSSCTNDSKEEVRRTAAALSACHVATGCIPATRVCIRTLLTLKATSSSKSSSSSGVSIQQSG